MEHYFLFLFIAFLTVLSPGPGVVLTLSNAIRFGVKGALGGILGIASGTFIVAGVAASSLGVLLATSSVMFSVVKYLGAAYLIYLGIRLWRSSGIKLDTSAMSPKSHRIKFLEGLTLQLTNPKAVFFFLSIFPQSVDAKQAFVPQFALLVATYSCLVIVIHLCYASLAHHARDWFSSNRGTQMFNKLGGSIFVFFGIGLASSNK